MKSRSFGLILLPILSIGVHARFIIEVPNSYQGSTSADGNDVVIKIKLNPELAGGSQSANRYPLDQTGNNRPYHNNRPSTRTIYNEQPSYDNNAKAAHYALKENQIPIRYGDEHQSYDDDTTHTPIEKQPERTHGYRQPPIQQQQVHQPQAQAQAQYVIEQQEVREAYPTYPEPEQSKSPPQHSSKHEKEYEHIQLRFPYGQAEQDQQESQDQDQSLAVNPQDIKEKYNFEFQAPNDYYCTLCTRVPSQHSNTFNRETAPVGEDKPETEPIGPHVLKKLTKNKKPTPILEIPLKTYKKVGNMYRQSMLNIRDAVIGRPAPPRRNRHPDGYDSYYPEAKTRFDAAAFENTGA